MIKKTIKMKASKGKHPGGRPRLDPSKKVRYRSFPVKEELYKKLLARSKRIRVPLAKSAANVLEWLASDESEGLIAPGVPEPNQIQPTPVSIPFEEPL